VIYFELNMALNTTSAGWQQYDKWHDKRYDTGNCRLVFSINILFIMQLLAFDQKVYW